MFHSTAVISSLTYRYIQVQIQAQVRVQCKYVYMYVRMYMYSILCIQFHVQIEYVHVGYVRTYIHKHKYRTSEGVELDIMQKSLQCLPRCYTQQVRSKVVRTLFYYCMCSFAGQWISTCIQKQCRSHRCMAIPTVPLIKVLLQTLF